MKPSIFVHFVRKFLNDFHAECRNQHAEFNAMETVILLVIAQKMAIVSVVNLKMRLNHGVHPQNQRRKNQKNQNYKRNQKKSNHGKPMVHL